MQGEVIVRFKYGGEGNGNGTAIKKDGQSKGVSQTANEEENDNSKLFTYAKNKVMQLAKNVLLSEALYESEKYFNLTDNVQGKRNLNIARQNVERVWGIAQDTIVGAKAGGVVGAIIGFGVGLTELGVKIYQGYDQQSIKIRQMEEQLDYTRQRMGYSLTVGSNGENR